MVTIVMEIINKECEYKGFYQPAIDGFKKGCRTWNTVHKNIETLVKKAIKMDFVKDLRIIIYDGKYEYYKKNEALEIYTNDDLCDMGIL